MVCTGTAGSKINISIFSIYNVRNFIKNKNFRKYITICRFLRGIMKSDGNFNV